MATNIYSLDKARQLKEPLLSIFSKFFDKEADYLTPSNQAGVANILAKY